MKLKLKRQLDNYDDNGFDQASNETGLKCLDKSLAQQQFGEEVDINTIVKRFNLTGQLPTNFNMPTYGDFTGISDYHTALNVVRAADEEFLSLPADLRARFDNDPGKLIEFLENDENRDEAVKLGLVAPKAAALTGGPAAPSAASDDEGLGGTTTRPPKSPKKAAKAPDDE